MSFFIGIACPWLLVAVLLVMAHRRSEDPTAGQWRSEPSTFFGGPEPADAGPAAGASASGKPAAAAASAAH